MKNLLKKTNKQGGGESTNGFVELCFKYVFTT